MDEVQGVVHQVKVPSWSMNLQGTTDYGLYAMYMYAVHVANGDDPAKIKV